MVRIVFSPAGRRVDVEKGVSLLEAAQMAGIKVRSICGGKGTCGKCKVIVDKGFVSFSEEHHLRHVSEEERTHDYYLACMAFAETDSEVFLPVESRLEGPQVLTRAISSKIELDPYVKKIFFEDPGKLRAVSRELRIPEVLLKSIEESQHGNLGFTLIFRGGRIIDVEVGDTSFRNFGVAIDVGTTTIVLYLVDLADGAIVDLDSDYNEQILYGEDLLSRIEYARTKKNGVGKLQSIVVASINNLLSKLVERNRVFAKDINDITIAGNTVMTHLLLGQDPVYLSQTNVAVSRDAALVKASKLGIDAGNAEIYCMPSVSRYVGGDVIGDIIASGLYESPEISLLIDMGTNGEIILGSSGWLFSVSCASGPAFEGWEIRYGMRAVEGAIEHVRIDDKLRPTYTIIGSRKPRGICGSGLIDLIAEMFLRGILDTMGKIQGIQTPRIRKGLDGLEYVVAPAQKTDIARDIVVTQRDINNLMQSKAAVCAGISVLMKKMGLSVYDIKNLYLAGAFGNYVDPKSAERIGIYPELPNAKTIQIGNGALAGAYMVLVSQKNREKAGEIARKMTYYDLSADGTFMDEFNEALYLPGKQELFPGYKFNP